MVFPPFLRVMGRHIDAANAGRNSFRPNPFEFAEIMYNLNPRADPDAVLDTPASDAISAAPIHVASNSNNRIDFARYSRILDSFRIGHFRAKPRRGTRKPHTGWK